MTEEELAAHLARYQRVRHFTNGLCEPLQPEDQVVQSMPDVSPTRWHLAHTTWFFETFVLKAYDRTWQPVDARYEHLFNSYYNSVGEPFPRARRGLLSRPTVAEVMHYRSRVDEAMAGLFARLAPDASGRAAADVVALGCHHEQQHQELLLMDIKHVFACNPMHPVYRPERARRGSDRPSLAWIDHPGGLLEIGHAGDGFAFDNESPRHPTFLQPFQLADRLVTNGEFLEFIEDGGYERPEYWLAAGWDHIVAERIGEPLYWRHADDCWQRFTLGGLVDVDVGDPVSHVSYYEADAFARWADARLPTEAEWEVAAAALPITGHFVEQGVFEPRPAPPANGRQPRQMFGDLWEWTQSAYAPYPGFVTTGDALGEYNGKFMCNQYVLRGGACISSADHLRATYRNFFPPHSRWMYSGIRLAR